VRSPDSSPIVSRFCRDPGLSRDNSPTSGSSGHYAATHHITNIRVPITAINTPTPSQEGPGPASPAVEFPPELDPEPDGDSDGISDAYDFCRDTYETRNGYQDGDGCPDELPEDLVVGLRPVQRSYRGDSESLAGSKTLTASERADLRRVLATLNIEISGHGSCGEIAYSTTPSGEATRDRTPVFDRWWRDEIETKNVSRRPTGRRL
jgi:hypothetical protein